MLGGIIHPESLTNKTEEKAQETNNKKRTNRIRKREPQNKQ